jgi:hypothetical protein
MSNKFLPLCSCALAISVSACVHGKDAKTAYEKGIKPCAVSDLNGKNILYFGPSNAVGTGSIWRKDNSGVFHLRYDLSQMPDPKNFLADSTPFDCTGSDLSKFAFGANASLDAQPVSAELKADIQRGRTVESKATLAWVPIQEGAYKDYVDAMPAAGPRADLMAGDKYVLARALKVASFETTLEYSSTIAAGLSGKYNGPLPANLAGNAGGGLTASWTGGNKLTLKSNGSFYIAGEFQPYLPSGFAAAGKVFGPVERVAVDARTQRDPL